MGVRERLESGTEDRSLWACWPTRRSRDMEYEDLGALGRLRQPGRQGEKGRRVHSPELRIALCGHVGQHDAPGTWSTRTWERWGGYDNQGGKAKKGGEFMECIWLSPQCVKGQRSIKF